MHTSGSSDGGFGRLTILAGGNGWDEAPRSPRGDFEGARGADARTRFDGVRDGASSSASPIPSSRSKVAFRRTPREDPSEIAPGSARAFPERVPLSGEEHVSENVILFRGDFEGMRGDFDGIRGDLDGARPSLAEFPMVMMFMAGALFAEE